MTFTFTYFIVFILYFIFHFNCYIAIVTVALYTAIYKLSH